MLFSHLDESFDPSVILFVTFYHLTWFVLESSKTAPTTFPKVPLDVLIIRINKRYWR